LQQKHSIAEKSDLIDLYEASKLLNQSKSTIYKLTALKSIPHFKRDGSNQLIFSRTDLDYWRKEAIAPKPNLVEEHIHRKLTIREVQNS
jgi:excisionase family DNA binding protein